MRINGWSLVALGLLAPTLAAQTNNPVRPVAPPGGAPTTPGASAAPAPPAVPAAPVPPADPKVTALLTQWEQKMKTLQAIEAEVVRVETDPVTNTNEVFHGKAKFLRPDRAELYMVKKTNPQVFERFLFTGAYLYEFRPQNKIIRIHQVPQRAPGQAALDDNFMGLLFGMDATAAQRRYDLQLVKSDQWYHYLIVKPKLPADKAEFSEARLVLFVQSLLPREITFIPPNGSALKWDIPRIDPAPRIGPSDFVKPQLPQGWQWVQVPPAGGNPGPATTPTSNPPPPSRVRPNGQ